MIILVEVAIILGLIYGGTRITLKLLANHQELKVLREERTARLEAAQTSKDIAQELLLDKEMAGEVRHYLTEGLDCKSLPSSSDN